MKRIVIAILLTYLMLFSCVCAHASEETSVVYDYADGCIVIKAKLNEVYGHAVMLIVTKQTSAYPDLSQSNTAADVCYTTDNGEIEHTVSIPNSFDSGKYYVRLTSENDSLDTYFMNLRKEDAKGLVVPVNRINSRAEMFNLLSEPQNRFAIDTERLSEYLEEISAIFYDVKKQKTYNVNNEAEMINDLRISEAGALFNSGAPVLSVLSRYYSLFGADLNEYNALAENTRLTLNQLLKNADYAKMPADKLYKQLFILAKVKTSANANSLKRVFAEYGDELSTDNTYMNKLVNKDEVYSQMYENLQQVTDFNSISTVYYNMSKAVYDVENKPSDGGGGGGGGRGGNTMGISVGTELANSINSETKQNGALFGDLKGHWAEQYVKRLNSLNIVNGFEDGSFKPSDLITRAEFLKMVVCAFKISADSKADFKDVNESDWYSTYCNAGFSAGIISGNIDGYFEPNSNVTRQDAAVIAYRAIKKYQTELALNSCQFKDQIEVSDYAGSAVSALGAMNILTGDENGLFRPLDCATRAEAAAVICRVLDLQGVK